MPDTQRVRRLIEDAILNLDNVLLATHEFLQL
jgi:hypothetical protein